MITKKDIKVGVKIKALVTRYDLIKDNIYLITEIVDGGSIFCYTNLTNPDIEDNTACIDDEIGGDLYLFELVNLKITNWRKRLK